MAIRTAALCAIGIFWLSISTESLIRFSHRHDPNLVDLELQVLENPDCMECKQKLNQYKQEKYAYPQND